MHIPHGSPKHFGSARSDANVRKSSESLGIELTSSPLLGTQLLSRALAGLPAARHARSWPATNSPLERGQVRQLVLPHVGHIARGKHGGVTLHLQAGVHLHAFGV